MVWGWERQLLQTQQPFCTSDEIVYRLCHALLISHTSDFNPPAPFRG